MRMKSLALGLAVLGLMTAAAHAANLVTNGGFEDTTTAGKQYFAGDVTGWSGGTNLTFLDTPGTADDGSYLSVYGPYAKTSPVGGNFVEADGDPNYSSAFYQTINGLTVGQSYYVDFWQAAGQQVGFTGATTERWSVSLGGDSQLSSLFSLPQGGVGPWQWQRMTFTATSASEVLSFLAVGTPGGAPPISFLDGVSVSAVPESATWAMMILGLGALGGLARSRRRAAIAA
jgi:hypothetical protein